MPIHDLGYREWSGQLESSESRWTVVAGVGIRRAWQSAWLRRAMFFAWIPAAAMGFMIFIYERAAEDGGLSARVVQSFADLFLNPEPRQQILDSIRIRPSDLGEQPDLVAGRHQFWSSLLLILLFQRSQSLPARTDHWPDCTATGFAGRAFAGISAVLFSAAVSGAVRDRKGGHYSDLHIRGDTPARPAAVHSRSTPVARDYDSEVYMGHPAADLRGDCHDFDSLHVSRFDVLVPDDGIPLCFLRLVQYLDLWRCHPCRHASVLVGRNECADPVPESLSSLS